MGVQLCKSPGDAKVVAPENTLSGTLCNIILAHVCLHALTLWEVASRSETLLDLRHTHLLFESLQPFKITRFSDDVAS